MAKIAPFRGIRYNRNKVQDLSLVVTQPYDRIRTDLQDRYYDRHPYSIVRIIKGRELETDTPDGENVYSRAADYCSAWLDAGYLQRSSKPAFYVYHQTFKHPDGTSLTRKAFIAALELARFEEGIVLPHERTLSGPKVDRLNLLRATEVNFGQIFMLYPDPQNRINAILENAIAGREPDIDLCELFEADVRQQVWVVDDEDVVAQVVAEMGPKRGLIIADGHHRYETAINFRDEMRQKHPDAPANAAFNYCMTTLVSMDDPGLTILPTHREIHDYRQKSVEQVLADAQAYFEVTPVASREALAEAMAQATPADRRIGFYDGRYYLLRLADPQIMAKVVPDRAEEWRMLDVSILHELLIERVMGIDKARVEAKENLDYHRDLDLALQQVDEGRAQCLFILNPTRMSEVKACSDKGEKMPQKSTDFYPKVIAGLVALAVGPKERL
ncbi:MAG: DUF1015 domain-containing protein [Anaerolineae bacterium]|jgi:uncharacterized protein (DUF1015 family)|nr:DUF1015 domain-containing protein [Anaerolineae bacterium]MDX9829253.1 DUF1015 domain-containing protein [Anaerolineae bacterium]